MRYFVVFLFFQSRNAHIQRLNFDQFDPFSQMTSKVCYKNKKKLRKSEPGGGLNQGEDA